MNPVLMELSKLDIGGIVGLMALYNDILTKDGAAYK